MTHIESFDNMDEMMAAMAASEDMHNANLLPGQIRLRDAVDVTGFWAQPVPDWGIVVYGITPPIAEVQPNAGFDVADNRERGYVTGTAFSEWEDGGEWGDTHVSQVVPIDGGVFALAKDLGWPGLDKLRHPAYRELGMALATAEAAARV